LCFLELRSGDLAANGKMRPIWTQERDMKRTLLFVLLLLSVARPSIAAELRGLIAVGIGTLSTNDNVAVAANLNAGERISLLGLGLDFDSTEGFCGLGRDGASGLLISGSSKRLTSITVPVSDFYMYLCLKRSGLSSEFGAVMLDGLVFPGAATSDEDPDLEALVQEALDRRFGR
jgi:hypothetical protein